MSATLPNLDILTDIKDETVQLLKDREKYFTHPCYKNRVKAHFELLEADSEKLFEYVKKMNTGNKKQLIEFIVKNLNYHDQIGELFYIEDGEKYFENQKLNRKKVQGEIGEFVDFI